MARISIEAQRRPNIPPEVNAGDNQTINLPQTVVSLLGTTFDVDGYIVSTVWTRVSGPTGITILNPNTLNPQVSGLTIGTFVFQLEVTDNYGATARDTVTITVENYQTYSYTWVGGSTSCIGNTGQSQYNNLGKVSDDGNLYPLDAYNHRTSESGLTQHTRPNTIGDPYYKPPFTDHANCPIYVWGKIFEENTETFGGANYAHLVLRTYIGGSATTPPPDTSLPYNCSNTSIPVAYNQSDYPLFPNNFTVSMVNVNNILLTPPNTISGNPKYPKMLVYCPGCATGGDNLVLWGSFQGKVKNEWMLLQVLTT